MAKQYRYDKEKHGEWTGDAYYITKPRLGPDGIPYKDIARDTAGFHFELIRHGINSGYFCTTKES